MEVKGRFYVFATIGTGTPETKRILEENIEPVYEKEVVISSILVIIKLEKAIATGVVDLD